MTIEVLILMGIFSAFIPQGVVKNRDVDHA